MKKSGVLLIHGVFWLGNLILLLLILGILNQSGALDESEGFSFFRVAIGMIVVPAVFSFYAFYFFLFPKYLQKKQVTQSLLYGFGVASIGSLLSTVALYLLLDFTFSCYQESNFLAFPVTIFVGLLYGVVALVIKGFITWYQEIKLKEALKEKNHEMEMALVKSQLDPHFLFNTINNIDVLIIKNAKEASDYLNKLSDIMRFMLFETKSVLIPLTKELKYIEKYIELQKIRTSNEKYVQYEVNGAVEKRHIAPMVFIPFIENAFKHTNNKKIENAIQVAINITEQGITLLCENKFDPHRPRSKDSNGLGNELIKKRLNLIYPEQHTLTMHHQEDIYSVHLTIHNEQS